LDDGFSANSDIVSDKALAKRIAGRASDKHTTTTGAAHGAAHGAKVSPLRSGYYVHVASPQRVTISTPHLRIVLSNSDRFLNQAASLLDLRHFVSMEQLEGVETGATPLSATESIHGVLGQTVHFRRYANQWRFIEGTIEDYAVDHLFDHTSSKFSLFQQ
jgi:hypothetical protein